jgi:hypothetical protein
MKQKSTLKNGTKGQKIVHKKLIDFDGKRERNERVSTLLWPKDYVGYVGWKNLESYVEMVAGLPINKQLKDQELLN